MKEKIDNLKLTKHGIQVITEAGVFHYMAENSSPADFMIIKIMNERVYMVVTFNDLFGSVTSGCRTETDKYAVEKMMEDGKHEYKKLVPIDGGQFNHLFNVYKDYVSGMMKDT